MTPHYAHGQFVFTPHKLILILCLLPLAGCTSTAIRSQSPEDSDLAGDDAQTELIGDVAGPYGLHYVTVEGPALVTGLKDTGSDPPPSAARSALENDMHARGVLNIKKILASPTTSLVWVRAHLPPGVHKGDPLDLEVRVLADSETTDLSGGWVMPTRLREKAIFTKTVDGAAGSSRTLDGHEWAVAQGAILVDPLMQSGQDPASLTRGRVLSGAQALKGRNLWLILKRDKKSVPLSKKVGDALNRRFHTFTQGSKQGIATPKDDEKIEIVLHSRYRHNIPRYISVLRSVAVYETPAQQLARLERLERQLLDPFTSATAALRLEAIGKPALDVLRKGLTSKDAEVRFYSAEALAYLDDSAAAAPLAQAARNEPAFRVFALTALSTMDDVAAADELRTLLDVPSAETRYGAFRALWGMNRDDPLVKGTELHGKLTLHVIPTTAPPMVHVTRSIRPEVVLFGQDQYLQAPFTLEAGKSTVVKATAPDRVVISRFALGEPDRELVTSSRMEEVIRGVVEAGGQYPDVVQLLHAAKLHGALASRFEVEAVPQAGRSYDRPADDGDKTDRASFEVLGSLPNLFGRRAADVPETDASTTDEPAPNKDESSTNKTDISE